MANRYWVGGTAAWDAAYVWSTTSGGAGGASSPTLTDDVIIDQTGPYTIQAPSGGAECRNLSIFASNVTLSASVQLYGSLNAGNSSNTINASFIFLYGTGLFSLNGATCSSDIWWISGSPNYQLASALVTTGNIYFDYGDLTTSNYNVTCNSFLGGGGSSTRNINLGTSTLTATGTGNSIQFAAINFFVSFSTGASLTFTGSGFVQFNGGSGNYPALRFNNSGNSTIVGSNTFVDISSNTTTGKTINFQASATNTFISFNLRGSSGNFYTLGSTNPGVQASIRKSGTWYMGANSVDAGGNSGLVFTAGSGIDYLFVSYINGISVGGAGNFLPFL